MRTDKPLLKLECSACHKRLARMEELVMINNLSYCANCAKSMMNALAFKADLGRKFINN